MKTYHDGTHYSSFAEVAEALYNLKPVRRVTKDAEKLKTQQERFLKNHLCPVCKQPMTLVRDTNIMTCTNEKCAGKKIKMADGSVKYAVVFDELDEHGTTVANAIL